MYLNKIKRRRIVKSYTAKKKKEFTMIYFGLSLTDDFNLKAGTRRGGRADAAACFSSTHTGTTLWTALGGCGPSPGGSLGVFLGCVWMVNGVTSGMNPTRYVVQNLVSMSDDVM